MKHKDIIHTKPVCFKAVEADITKYYVLEATVIAMIQLIERPVLPSI